MAITDLTNTTWEIPAGWTATAGYGQFDVYGTILDISGGPPVHDELTEFDIGYHYANANDLKEGILTAIDDKILLNTGPTVVTPSNPSTVTITGGTDATNPNLISWLEANGTQVVPKTLKGKWLFNDRLTVNGWNALSGVDATKSEIINFTSNNTSFIAFRWYAENDGDQFQYLTYVGESNISPYNLSEGMGNTYWHEMFGDEDYQVYRTVDFGETEQPASDDFYAWFTANAVEQAEPEQTDTKPIYKRVNGAWVKLTAFERVNGEWVKISSAVETEEPEQPQDPENCLTFSSPSSFTLGVVDNLKYWDGTLEYSTDGSTWTTWAGTSAISSASDGTKHNLYMRGTGNTYITGSSAGANKARWSLTGSNISCNGNIETLLDYATVANGEHPPMATHCYYYLFYTCSNLVTAPALPATTLSYYCYGRMFRSCTSLTTAPKLPATTLADYCYYQMFRYCTSLVTLPELPATTLTTHCYEGMFQSCSQIKLSTTQTGEYQTAYRIPSNGTGTSADYWNTNMFVSTGGTYVGSLSINTTYYTSNTVV